MKNSTILKKTKKLIENGHHKFICYAIAEATNCSPQGKALKWWVSRLLDRWASYESWMAYNHPDMRVKMSISDFKQGRLQWLDYMIAVCEEQEAEEK